MIPAVRRVHASATPAGARHLADELDAFCDAQRLPAEACWPLRVALDEIAANIVSHGATGSQPADIEVAFEQDRDGVRIVVADTGPPFDPLSAPEPDTTSPLDTRKPGGLGIALVRSLMDDVRYERTERNVVTLRKNLVPGALN